MSSLGLPVSCTQYFTASYQTPFLHECLLSRFCDLVALVAAPSIGCEATISVLSQAHF